MLKDFQQEHDVVWVAQQMQDCPRLEVTRKLVETTACELARNSYARFTESLHVLALLYFC